MHRRLAGLLIVCLVLVGCSDGGQQQITELNEKIDSLERVNASNQTDISNLTSFITVLSDGLDSIARQEDMLFTNKGREGIGIDRDQLKRNLEMFESMLSQQKERISQLVDSLKARGANMEKLNNLVRHLNQQLNEKNQAIQSLRADLDKKNVSIAQLKSRVASLSESNTLLTEKVERQVQALKTQDEVINEGYVKIGTKKALMEGGYVSGGFLKKTKVNYQSLPKNKFMRVDIRNFTEIPIQSSNPKVLSQMPPSSYELRKTGNGTTTLHIIDPNAFWSISNYLIIQTN